MAFITQEEPQSYQAAEGIGEDAQQFKTFFEQNPAPMWVYDLDTLYFLAVNKAAIETYGYSRTEFLSMTITDIRSEKDVPALLEALPQRTGTAGSWAGVWCHEKKDGSTIDMEIISNPILFRGKPAHLVQAFDVSARERAEEALRESEARYRAVVEYLPYAMSVSVDGKVVYVNPAALKAAGVDNPEALIGHSVLEFIREDYRAATLQRFSKMLTSGLPSSPIEVKLRRPDGQIVDAESMGVPIIYGGKPAILNSFRDITEYRRRGEALQAIVKATAGTGDDFFRGLVAELAKVLDMRYAFIGELLPGPPERIRSIVAWANGEVAPNFDYALAGTPCAHVVGRKFCHFPNGIQEMFPEDKMLGEMGAISYLGIPLFNTSGTAIGLLCVLDTRPMPNSELAESLMTVFGARAAAELERNRADDAVRESETRYRAVVECVPYGMAVSVDDKLIYVNPVGAQFAGAKKPDRLIGRPVLDFVHEDFREIVRQRRDQMLETGRPAPPMKGKLRGPCGEIDAEWSGVPILFGGKPAILNAFRDITENVWAEGLLAGEKRVLESIARRKPLADVLNEICCFIEHLSPEAMSSILLLDQHGKQLWPVAGPKLPESWTRALTPLTIGPDVGSCGSSAFRKEQIIVSDISTDPLWTKYPEYSTAALKCGLRACWSTPILAVDGSVLGTFALYYQKPRRPSPKELDLIRQVTHLASVAIEHDRAAEALRRARDELELRVQERTAELVRANERLEELDRLKSEFLASMSHELRTPLNSIIGFTGILQQGFAGPVNEEQKKQLGLVFGSAKHLLSLINDLLDLSRIEAGKAEIEHEPFNFVEVVHEVIDNLAPMANQKKLRLISDLPGPRIDMVGDRKRCFQVLLNLANNAVKFTHCGEVKIIVHVDATNLRVCVADTGIGIKPEQMGLLFEAFRQADSSARRMYEGTGLGLHLCRRLLNLMDGTINVESTYGEGSWFTFVLPLRLPSMSKKQG